VILDTNAVSALLSGDEGLGRLLASAERHHLPIQVIGEYQFGLLASNRRRHLQALFRRLEADCYILAPDRETADIYARIRYDLKHRGRPIPENDVWIAALARQFSLDVASLDPHFDEVRRIRRLDW
jgi:predicted nucleic acid-binding protein